MKNIFVLALLCFYFTSYTQIPPPFLPDCVIDGFPEFPDDPALFDLANNPYTGGDITVKLYFNHVKLVNDSSGDIDPTLFNAFKNNIEQGFLGTGINFDFHCRTIPIEDDNLALNGLTVEAFLDWEAYKHSDGIDLFFVPGLAGSQVDFAGRANNIPGNWAVVQGRISAVNGHTAVHELGHLFGLYHIDHGWNEFFQCSNGPSSSGCTETLSNGLSCGDYIIDTSPSHPLAEKCNDCDPTNSPGGIIFYKRPQDNVCPFERCDNPLGSEILDIPFSQGVAYNPPMNNYMVIGRSDCRNTFSSDQIQVMKNHLTNHYCHANVLVPTNSLGSGPVCECDFGEEVIINDDFGPLWSTAIGIDGLDPNLLTDRKITIEDELIIDTDYTFTNCEFEFYPGASMTISAGVNVLINGNATSSLLDGCGGQWDGVSVSGQLTLESTTLSNAKDGLKLLDGSTTNIIDAVIQNCDQGISAIGNADIPQFTNTQILNNSKGFALSGFTGSPTLGVFIDNTFIDNNEAIVSGYGVIGLSYSGVATQENKFIDNNYGIVLGNSYSIEIAHNIFQGGTRPIALNRSTAEIHHNTFDGSGFGVWSQSSTSTIFTNQMGLNSPLEEAIRLLSSHNTVVYDNDIVANNSAAEIIFSNNVEFRSEINTNTGNRITVNAGPNAIYASAISALFSNGLKINSATINSSNNQGALLLRSCSDALIENNNITATTGSGTKGVRIAGGDNNLVAENTIVTNSHAIEIRSAADHIIECNDLQSSTSAIWVGTNSSRQGILKNYLSSTNHEVYTRSNIGEQRFHKNEFLSGNSSIFADGFTFDQVDDFPFVVDTDDPINHPTRVPSLAIPSSFLKFDNFTTQDNDVGNCVGGVGSNFIGVTPPEEALCSFLDVLQTQQNGQPETYFIQLYHILRYYSNHVPTQDWPECLNTVVQQSMVCGLMEIMTVENNIRSTVSVHSADQATILALIEQNEGSESNESNYESLTQLYQTQETELIILMIESISDLNHLSCTEHVVSIWKESVFVVLEILATGQYTQASVPLLQSHAHECIEMYGDGVAWARGALSTSSPDTLYDDSCLDVSELRLDNFPSSRTNDLIIAPNPAFNQFTISNLEVDKSITIEISDIQGKIVWTKKGVLKQDKMTINSSDWKAGIYLIRSYAEDKKEQRTAKLVIHK